MYDMYSNTYSGIKGRSRDRLAGGMMGNMRCARTHFLMRVNTLRLPSGRLPGEHDARLAVRLLSIG